MFTALYIITAGIVGSFLGPFAHGYPEHFLRGFLMAGLVVRTRRMWSATMMGLASGLVFVLVVPSPAPYLLASTFVSGLVFDLVLLAGSKYGESVKSLSRIMLGSGISGIAESITALAFLTFLGTFGSYAEPISIIWGTDISVNIVLSLVGSVIAFRFLTLEHRSKQDLVLSGTNNPEIKEREKKYSS